MPSAQTSLDARAYDLDGGALARDMETRSVTVDPFTMSATCVFSTGAMDRVGDVVEIDGIRTENHRRNPVVFWNHAKHLTLPIGKTVDNSGAYTVILAEDATQTTFFSQSLLEAEQIFRLIDEGIINANSIAFDNKRVQPIFVAGVRKGLHVLECDLLEISWVGLPVNPEATRKAIDSLVCGRVLAEPIRRSLEPYAARAAAWANGVTLKCYDVRAAILKAAEFEENKHPRATDGRFGDKPGEHEGGDDEPDDDEDEPADEADDEEEEEVDEEAAADEASRSRAAETSNNLPDKRPDTVLGANVELRSEGDWVISLATGEPVHLDDYEGDLSRNLEKILPQIKKRDDLNALNEELDTIGDEERVFYNGSKPEVISGDGIDNETLAAINTVAWRSGGDLAAVANLNDEIAGDTDFRVLPAGKYKVDLVHSDHVAEYFDESVSNAAGLSVEIDAYPESGRAEMANRWNQFLEDHFADTRLFPDVDEGRYAAIDTAMLSEPDRVAEYIADQYDLSDGGEARVEWFNDLMAEYGSGDRLMLTLEDGELVVEIADGPETVKGLRFWSTKSIQKGRWVTMGEGDGGTHVYLDDDGTIRAGPEKLEGKKISTLASPKEPANAPKEPGKETPRPQTNGPEKKPENLSTSVDKPAEAGKIPSAANDQPKETKMDATAERGSKLITPARIGKYGKKIGASLDADKFSEEFGIPMTGDSANPGYRAYRVIQDHIDYNSQLEAMGRPASTNLGEDSTTDLIRSVGESKAKEIADAFGLLLEKTS